MKAVPRFMAMAIAALWASAGFLGCAGYHMGAKSLYAPDVETVYVPIFESKSFRRELGERLTEAVVKEIEKRSTLKVVHTPTADSVLSGTILEDRKRVQAQNVNDEPRSAEFNLSIQVSWVDRRGALIREQMAIPMPPELHSLSQPGTFVTEGGQTVATGQLQAIDRLAKLIVDRMEVPW